MKTTVIALAALALGNQVAFAKDKKETNRQVIDRFFEAVDSKQLAKLAEVEDPNIVMQTPMGTTKGTAAHQQLTQGFGTAFPNFKHNTRRCLESGETISCEGTFTGDHTGPLMTPDGKTVPATQKHVEFPYAGFARVKNGRVVEMHAYFDMMGFMQQLGVVPPPGKPVAAAK